MLRVTRRDRLKRSEDQLIAEAGEIAGEIFLLPPDVTYDFEQFNEYSLDLF